jgi:hypothetical protein
LLAEIAKYGTPTIKRAYGVWTTQQFVETWRFSRVFNGRAEMIDHVLVSHTVVHRIDFIDTSTPELPSVGETPASSQPDAPSDHAAVIARVRERVEA